MAAIVRDTGALLAAERRNPGFLALHDDVTAARIRPLVPVVVLAQAWRGEPQHQISRATPGRETGRPVPITVRRRAELDRDVADLEPDVLVRALDRGVAPRGAWPGPRPPRRPG